MLAPTAELNVEPIKRKKAAKTSPTQRSLKELRKRGYLCAVVEKWNPHVKIRQDMFGFVDIVAIKDDDIIGVQSTGGDGGNVAARVTKITEHDNYPIVIKAMRIIVHGWRRNAQNKWILREIEL